MLMSGSVLCEQHPCPSQECSCDYGTELVDCRRRGLVTVPTFQPSNVSYEKLRLSDNNIRYIVGSAFSGIRFRKLEIVDNPLQFVDEAAFAGLESTLADVVLQLDAEAPFPYKALRPLRHLTTLTVTDFGGSRLPTGALSELRTLRELHLTKGSLETLTVADVTGQRSSLEVLDISDNKLREFPTDAIRSLAAIRVLNVRANLIDHLGGSSIASSSLQELDISHHALDRAGINSSAFDTVASTLRRLVMSQCHLADRHAAAITRAAAVSELILPFNHFTSVRTFLADMANLERLDVQNNSVDVLKSVSLPSARRLRALNLAYNPLRDVHPDAFVELRALAELKLDYARAAMPLHGGSFASQRSTLHNLSLPGVDLSRPKWSVIDGLDRLEMLSLSNCRLGNIPPFTFRNSSGRLHTLELARNHIDEVNQTAFVGLETSLVRLNLDGNRLTTIDRCSFHGFTRLKPTSLRLRQNPLVCDCRLEWLYNWTAGSHFIVNWHCDDGDMAFAQLIDADFQHCNDSNDSNDYQVPCEDFTLTTTSTPSQPLTGLFVVNITSTSFAVRWTVDLSALPAATFSGFRLNCSCADSRLSANRTVREYLFKGLSGGVAYRVCVMLDYLDVNGSKWTEEAGRCLSVTTTTWLSDSAVMSVVVVVAVLLVVLPLTLVICLIVRRWRRRRRMRLAELAQPKIAVGKTKRFQRQQRPQSVDGLDNDRLDTLRFQSRSVETNLDTLSDEDDDRYRTLLAIRLLQSRNARSLDNLVDGLNTAPGYFVNQTYMYGYHRDKVEQEVYDEINEAEVDGCKSPLTSEDTEL